MHVDICVQQLLSSWALIHVHICAEQILNTVYNYMQVLVHKIDTEHCMQDK